MAKHRPKEERQQQIFAAALKISAQKGYYNTTMDDLAAETALSKGNLYYHFANKERLFTELVKYRWQEYFQKISQLLKTARSSEEILRNIFNSQTDISKEKRGQLKSELEVVIQAFREESFKEIFSENMRYLLNLLTEIIELGKQNGEFTTKYPAGQMARLMLESAEGLKLLGLIIDKENEEQNSIDVFIDVLKGSS